jgi:hypothetical protein
MKIKKIASSKPLKFLILLLTSMLIASASAAVYYSLTWQPRVTVTGLFVQFTNGADTPSSSTVNPSWARLLLKSYPNATLTYDQGLNISNTDSSRHSISLRHVDISPANGNPSVANFTLIKFTLIAKNGTIVTTFQYTTTGNNWNTPSQTNYYNIPGGEQWTLQIQTLSPANATLGTQADLTIAVDVQE